MRQSIDVEGLTHGDLPIPSASRVGPFVATGGVRGVSIETGAMPDDPQAQADLMFDNLETILKAAGASVDNVLKVTIWLRDGSLRPIVQSGWMKLFPDPASRPARHTLIYDLPGGMAIQCDALAVVE